MPGGAGIASGRTAFGNVSGMLAVVPVSPGPARGQEEGPVRGVHPSLAAGLASPPAAATPPDGSVLGRR
jgi:hypothetical protein